MSKSYIPQIFRNHCIHSHPSDLINLRISHFQSCSLSFQPDIISIAHLFRISVRCSRIYKPSFLSCQIYLWFFVCWAFTPLLSITTVLHLSSIHITSTFTRIICKTIIYSIYFDRSSPSLFQGKHMLIIFLVRVTTGGLVLKSRSPMVTLTQSCLGGNFPRAVLLWERRIQIINKNRC